MRYVVVVAVLGAACFSEATPIGSADDDGTEGSDGTSATTDATTTGTDPSDADTTRGSDDADTTGTATSASTTGVAPRCGDGDIDVGEECDDGNATELDGCTAVCTNGPRPLQLELVPPPPVAGDSQTVDATESCHTGDGQLRVLGGLGGWRGGVDANNAWTVSLGGACMQIGLDASGASIVLAPDPMILTEHGYNVGQIDQWMLQCPEGAVPIGIDSRIFGGAPPNITAVRVHCGMAFVDPAAQTGVRVDPIGPSPWTMANDTGDERMSMCPTNTIAVGFRGDFDAEAAAIYTLGALCAAPTVPFGPE